MTRKIPILGVDLPPALRKAPNRELPPSLRKSEARTNYGGGPPPGYSIDDSESHLWREPTYRKHPTTGRLEAVDQGLFFRMWPEHVKKVREMKANGWPHVEIVRTAKELWRKQQDAYQDDQTLADQHREARQGERAQQVQDMRAGKLNDEPAEWGQPPQQFEQAAGNPFARGFSLDSPEEYAARLEDFRGKFYNRDPSGPGLGRQGNLMRGKDRSEPISRDRIRKVREVLDHPDFSKGVGEVSKEAQGAPYKLPPLPYAFDALEPVLSEETMRLHHGVHHKGYVDQLNEIVSGTRYEGDSPEELLFRVNARLGYSMNVQKVRDCAGGHVNHSMFFASLRPGGMPVDESSALYKDVAKAFGSWSKMLDELKDASLSRFGAGWGWLVLSEREGLIAFPTLNQDSPIMWGNIPLLGVDVWEHAYYLDYGPERAEYVDELLGVVDWSVVERRYEVATKKSEMGFDRYGDPTGFQVYIKKADTGAGERLLTPEQRRKKREMTFTRKEQGVLNAAPSPPPPPKNPNEPSVPKGP